MKKHSITLYVNDPMGKRWIINTESARREEKECCAEIAVIKKTSPEYAGQKDPPPCPSVAVDGRLIVTERTVSYDELRAALTDERWKEVTMPKTISLFLSTPPYFCENTETAVRIADAALGLMVQADTVIGFSKCCEGDAKDPAPSCG